MVLGLENQILNAGLTQVFKQVSKSLLAISGFLALTIIALQSKSKFLKVKSPAGVDAPPLRITNFQISDRQALLSMYYKRITLYLSYMIILFQRVVVVLEFIILYAKMLIIKNQGPPGAPIF